MANIKDVAKLAGVSISTVSNTISGTKFVSTPLKKRVREAIKELDYEVNPVASSLKSKSTKSIGVVIPDVSKIFFPQLIKGIQDYTSQKGYNFVLCSTNDDFEKEKSFVRMLESNWIDGIILDSVSNFNDSRYVGFLAKLGGRGKSIPVVSLERKVVGGDIRSVSIDNYAGGRMAVRHLIECGCRKVAHITGPSYCSMANERFRGYKDELKDNGLTCSNKRVVNGDFFPIRGYDAMNELLAGGIEIDGVFAANDQMAVGALKAMKEHGYRVPEDIKLAGFDNTFVSSLVEPALTTVDVPIYKMGTAAAKLLITQINGREGGGVEDVLLPINLIVRQSTGPKSRKGWNLVGW